MDAAESLRQHKAKQAESEIDDIEVEIWKGHYSAKTMIGYWISGVLLTLLFPISVAIGNPNRVAWLTMAILVGVMWLSLLSVSIYRKLSDHYWLTSQRLKHRNGILFRQSNRLELIDIDDVSYSQGPVQAMLGVGTIQLRSSDTSHPKLKMVGIARVQHVADLIDDARRTERRKRGLHIESI